MAKATVYGISTCDSCRKAKAWLEKHNVAFTWVDVRDKPPAKAQVQRWVKAHTAKPLRNTSGKSYRSLPEGKKTWTDDQWVKKFASDPMLIKRPVLEVDGKAVAVGFKPELWSKIF